MKKTILIHAAIALLMVFGAQAAFGITIKLSDRGVITNDRLDDSVQVQRAVNDLLASGGGTIEFPSGITDIKTQVKIVPDTYKPVNIIFKGDGGSVIRISVGQDGFAFYFGSLNQLRIENLVFTGMNVPASDPRFFDAKYVLFAGWVSLVKIVDSSFFGFAVPNEGAVVLASSNLTIDNCQFDGNYAQAPKGAVVNIDCCTLPGQNANIRNTTFLDYSHYNGQWFSKTMGQSGSWVRADQSIWSGDTEAQKLTIEDSFFDEGAEVAVYAKGIGSLHITGTKFNVSSSLNGAGFQADNVKRVRIEDSHFGWATDPRPIAILNDSTAEMIGLTRSQAVQCPASDPESAITWRLSDCN
jgi:hypothetical protein